MKTVYIAARFALKERVRGIYSKLEKLGYAVSEDWTKHELIKPYPENSALSEEYAIADINGVRKADLFIMISDEGGTGMYTELGAAIDHNLELGKPHIYVIGEHSSRSHFFFHPSVNRRDTIELVIEELSKTQGILK